MKNKQKEEFYRKFDEKLQEMELWTAAASGNITLLRLLSMLRLEALCQMTDQTPDEAEFELMAKKFF